MPKYIYEQTDWPDFRWSSEALAQQLAAVRHRQGRLIGRMQALGFPLREEAVLKTLTEDVLKSSEIEGEILDKDQVRSSIARRLGMDVGALPAADRNVDGVVEMMLDATQRFQRAAHGRAVIRLAWRALSDRTQRLEQDQSRRMAGRGIRSYAGSLRSIWSRKGPLRSARRRPARSRHEGLSRLVQRG